MQALKYAEQFGGEGHVEPGSVVANAKARVSLLVLPEKLDPSTLTILRELPSILEEVLHHDGQESPITHRSQTVFDGQLHLAMGFPCP
jgi:hypothetical protein